MPEDSMEKNSEGMFSQMYIGTTETDIARRVMSGIHDPIVAVDMNGNIVLHNQIVEDMNIISVVQKEEVLEGKTALKAVSDEKISQALSDAIANNGHIEFKHRINNKTYLVIADPYSDGISCAGAVARLCDITELERSEELKNTFISNVSHELRTPLTVIKGFAQNIEEDTGLLSEEKKRSYCRTMVSEVDRLTRLVNDMLLLSKLSAGTVKIEVEPLDISYCIGMFKHYLEQMTDKKNIKLRLEVPENVVAMFDYDKLRQMLVILGDNAVKHTKEGGSITLRVTDGEEAKRLLLERKNYVITNKEMSPCDFDGRICICIEDTGEGIPSDELASIFERFYTVDKSRSESTGIGLSLALEMMAAIGETVIVASDVGIGTIIGFTLRVATDPDSYYADMDDPSEEE